MDFSLNEEQRTWQMKARKFAQDQIRPISLKRDQISDPNMTFDWEIIKKGSNLGFRTAAVPEEWGGHGIDLGTQALVMAELARADSAISKTFSQCWKWSNLIAVACTEEQIDRFLTPFLADDTYLLGAAVTEPNAGSDNRLPPDNDPKAGYRLGAERKGNEWILNGGKCFIANGSVGKLFFVYARTNPNARVQEGTTLFLVPSDTPGFRVGKVFNKRGWRFYQNAEILFENARVPCSNVIGEVNSGYKARTGDPSQFGDLELAANALGICDAAIEDAMSYALTPQQGGKRISQQQMYQLRLSEMHVLTEALRSCVMRTAWERDQAVRAEKTTIAAPDASFAMVYSQEIVQRVTQLNMDVHASSSGSMNARADKLVRDAMVWTHLAGDTVQRIKLIKRHIS